MANQSDDYNVSPQRVNHPKLIANFLRLAREVAVAVVKSLLLCLR